MDQSYAHKFKPSSDFNNVKSVELLTELWQKLCSCNINWGENLDSRTMWNALAIQQDYGNFQRNNWGYILAKGGRAACSLKNVL